MIECAYRASWKASFKFPGCQKPKMWAQNGIVFFFLPTSDIVNPTIYSAINALNASLRLPGEFVILDLCMYRQSGNCFCFSPVSLNSILSIGFLAYKTTLVQSTKYFSGYSLFLKQLFRKVEIRMRIKRKQCRFCRNLRLIREAMYTCNRWLDFTTYLSFPWHISLLRHFNHLFSCSNCI